jgi:hypothetical protein
MPIRVWKERADPCQRYCMDKWKICSRISFVYERALFEVVQVSPALCALDTTLAPDGTSDRPLTTKLSTIAFVPRRPFGGKDTHMVTGNINIASRLDHCNRRKRSALSHRGDTRNRMAADKKKENNVESRGQSVESNNGARASVFVRAVARASSPRDCSGRESLGPTIGCLGFAMGRSG